MEHILHISKPNAKSYLIVCLAALFYLYEFTLQVSPSVMADSIMSDFGIGAAAFGAMSSIYYWAYTPMQIPAGVLFDRYSTKYLLGGAILVCLLGAFCFGLANSVFWLSVGRLCMGFGSAFSFIGVLVLTTRWFPPHYFAMVAGIAQLMSSVGALAGKKPLAHAAAVFGWQQTMTTMGFIGLGLLLLVVLVVQDYPPELKAAHHTASKGGQLRRFLEVCRSSQSWIIGIFALCNWAPVLIFAALWGEMYIKAVYHVNTAVAAGAVSMMWVSIGIFSPLIGWWSDKIGRRILPLVVASIIGLICSCGLILFPHMSLSTLYVVLFFLGAAASGQSLSFALVKDLNTRERVGSAIGFNNMAVVAGGLIFQPLVGWILHAGWKGQLVNGVPVYSIETYHNALIILPLTFLVAFILCVFFMRETHCHQV